MICDIRPVEELSYNEMLAQTWDYEQRKLGHPATKITVKTPEELRLDEAIKNLNYQFRYEIADRQRLERFHGKQNTTVL